MVSMMMRELVETALKSQTSKTRFAAKMADEAVRQGVYLSDDDLDALCRLASQYVLETVRLLESCATAGEMARADHVTKPVVAAAEAIFLHPCAAVETPRELFGAIACSYACRAFLSHLSERTRMVRGFPLLATDPHSEAQMIRRLLGEPLAARLDAEVERSLDDPRLHAATNGVRLLVGSLRASGRVSDWGDRWEDEMSRFGAATGFALR